jgi:CDP-diacylglycerol---serine O-phosphatidyltransferase
VDLSPELNKMDAPVGQAEKGLPAGEELRRAGPRRFRGVPLRLLIPNLITLLALCLGLTAIRFALEDQIAWAAMAIAVAAVLDGLDGRIARALKGTSRFGAELDSLADFVDFGVAPALVLYVFSLNQLRSLGWFAALIFAIACALRLARFNVMIDDPDRPAWQSYFFVGMPAPAGAITGLLPVYLHLSLLHAPRSPALAPFEIAYVLAIAWLMASRVPHFSGKSIGRVPREYVAVVLFALAAGILLLANFPMEMLAAMTLVYLAAIPFSVRRYGRMRRAWQAGASEPP